MSVAWTMMVYWDTFWNHNDFINMYVKRKSWNINTCTCYIILVLNAAFGRSKELSHCRSAAAESSTSPQNRHCKEGSLSLFELICFVVYARLLNRPLGPEFTRFREQQECELLSIEQRPSYLKCLVPWLIWWLFLANFTGRCPFLEPMSAKNN